MEGCCKKIDPLDLDVVIVVAGHTVGLRLDAYVQIVWVAPSAWHVVQRFIRRLIIKVPLAVGIEQLELLSKEIHVVLILPLVGGHLSVGKGSLVGVEGENLSAPGSE